MMYKKRHCRKLNLLKSVRQWKEREKKENWCKKPSCLVTTKSWTYIIEMVMLSKLQKRPFPIFWRWFHTATNHTFIQVFFVRNALSCNKRTHKKRRRSYKKRIESLDGDLKANQIHCGINRVGTVFFSVLVFVVVTRRSWQWYTINYCCSVQVHNTQLSILDQKQVSNHA